MLLFLTYLKSENICTKRYFTAEKNAESIFFLTCRSAKHVAIWYQIGQNTFCHSHCYTFFILSCHKNNIIHIDGSAL